MKNLTRQKFVQKIGISVGSVLVTLVMLAMAQAEPTLLSATSTTVVTLSATSITPTMTTSATYGVVSAVSGTVPTALPTSTSSYTPDPATIENSKTTSNTRNQITQIIFNEDFSKKSQNKVWRKKETEANPTTQETPSWLEKLLKWLFEDNSSHNTASLMGLIAKIIALVALATVIFWIAKNADTWLAWFKWSKSRQTHSLPETTIANHYRQAFAPLWQGLPEKSQLSAFVKEAVAKGDWLLALSTLYRGTLREIVDIYDLPITRATTERQSEWLLQKQNANPQESQFFEQLIDMWSKVAYGQARPTAEQVANFSHVIHQLASTWDSLYLHRQSHLEKRYQQLEQKKLPSIKSKGFFAKKSSKQLGDN